LYREYKDKVFRLCYSYCNDHALAEDLMQDSFSKVWQHLEDFQNKSSFSTWFYRIAVNTCLMHIRANKNVKFIHTPQLPEPQELPYDETELNKLYAAIVRLNEMDRILISMVLEDISYKEIGEVMGISENSVGVKVHRVKKQLKDIL